LVPTGNWTISVGVYITAHDPATTPAGDRAGAARG
jgi:hypothetical protein